MARSSSKALNRLGLKQSFVDKFRQSVKNNKREWDFRFRHAGYRLLLSYSFYVSAKRNVKDKSLLLPIIGLYYSFFHLIAALMCVDVHLSFEQLPRFPLDHYRTRKSGIVQFLQARGIDPKKIRHLSHKAVCNYVSHLHERGVISKEFFLSFGQTRFLRFQTNYAPAYFGYLGIDKEMIALTKRMQENIEEANRYIFALNVDYVQTSQRHGLGWIPQDLLESFIGDAIGDDFVDNYLNEPEGSEVFRILADAIPSES